MAGRKTLPRAATEKLADMMMCPSSRRFGGFARNGVVAIFAALMAGQVSQARADSYPERPVQLVVPAGPGSSTDTIMRSLAQVAAPLLGQSIVILNKPGASGTIGVSYVTRSEPDGYTIGGVPSGAITMGPACRSAKLPGDRLPDRRHDNASCRRAVRPPGFSGEQCDRISC
jgi:Tripartite tricarboxylate transporter family receptor